MVTLYKRWDAGRFPWLFSDDNKWKLEAEFKTHELATEYIAKHGSNAYKYKIEPTNSNSSSSNC